jgi:Zn-dependent protease
MTACAACSAELAETVLSCPQCRRLTHADELEDLAKRARAAWRVGDFATERALWEQSLALLPEDTVQYRTIQARLGELEQQSAAAAGSRKGWGRATAGIGPAIALLLTKGKFLLLGLTKMGTLLTMLASLGVYWQMYGLAFALGLVASIYIHEMGHVIELRRYGFPASAPMFIPGLGAFIRLRGVRVPPVVDSRIGLAGPLYGLGAAAAALVMYAATRKPIWNAIAHFGALINLFNLIPVWQLDGSRGFHSMTRGQRLAVVGIALALWMLTWHPMLFLIAAVGGYRLFTRDWQSEPDNEGLVRFALLLALLAVVGVLAPGVKAA